MISSWRLQIVPENPIIPTERLLFTDDWQLTESRGCDGEDEMEGHERWSKSIETLALSLIPYQKDERETWLPDGRNFGNTWTKFSKNQIYQK